MKKGTGPLSGIKIGLPKFHCKKCGHTWTPRTGVVFMCPRCKSPKHIVVV